MNAKELELKLSDALQREDILKQQLADSQREFRAADATIENLQMQVEKLASENAGLKEWSPNPHSASMFEAIEKAEKLMDDGMPELAMIEAFEILKMKRTPETDAFLAEVRAQARNEGINYAAGRLAAAFNHGFVDKPLAEVFDVVRMILDTKEELAGSSLPADDGLSGEYAEKFLTEFAAQLRKERE